MVRSVWSMTLVACVAMMFFSTLCQGLTDGEKSKIKDGIDSGKAMADALANSDFANKLTSIAKYVGPYLGTIGPFVSLVLGFIPSESALLQELRKMVDHIDKRFDKVDKNFDEVKRMIMENTFAIHFHEIEQNILAMEEDYQLLYKVSRGNFPRQKDKFIRFYRDSYSNTGTKFFTSLKSNSYINGNIKDKVMRYTKNDRRKTENFLIGVLKLLIKAMEIEIAAEEAQEHDAKYLVKIWEARTQEIVTKFREIDMAVKNKYSEQSKLDAIEFAGHSSNKKLSHSEFANKLHKLLKDKFYWRNWLVVVYDPVYGWNRHCIGFRDGHALFRENGRNIVIASLDENTIIPINSHRRESINTVAVSKSNVWGHFVRRADDIWTDLDKRGVMVTGVIISEWDVGFAYDGQRAFHYAKWNDGRRRICIFMWG